jgi:hypothetical protein
MDSFFWSVVFVLDGDFLKLPKFQFMVNGGSTEFDRNGWHGMYAFSADKQNDRIYPQDISFELFVNHAKAAADYWIKNRQWFDFKWRPET